MQLYILGILALFVLIYWPITFKYIQFNAFSIHITVIVDIIYLFW